MKQSYIADMVLSLKDKFAAVAWQGKARKIAYLSRLGSRPSNNAAIRARDPLWRKCNGRCTHLPTWFAARYIHYRMDDRARGHLMKLYILIIIGHTLKEVTCLIVWNGTRIKRKLNKKQKQKQNLQVSERSLILEYSLLVWGNRVVSYKTYSVAKPVCIK